MGGVGEEVGGGGGGVCLFSGPIALHATRSHFGLSHLRCT